MNQKRGHSGKEHGKGGERMEKDMGYTTSSTYKLCEH